MRIKVKVRYKDSEGEYWDGLLVDFIHADQSLYGIVIDSSGSFFLAEKKFITCCDDSILDLFQGESNGN